MADCWGHLCIEGTNVPITGAQAGLSVSPARSGDDFETVAGIRYAMTAYRPVRSWGIALSPWSPPEIVSVLRMLAARPSLSPRLYTADAAAVNLLPDWLADPSSPLGHHPVDGGIEPVELRDGIVLPLAMYASGATGVASDLLPILASTTYTLSAMTQSVGDLYVLEVLDRSLATLATVTLSSAAVSGAISRRTQAFTTGAAAAWMRVTKASGAPKVTGPVLVEGAGDGYWEPGQGIPSVQVDDPQAVLQSTAGGKVRSDYTVTLREVGL